MSLFVDLSDTLKEDEIQLLSRKAEGKAEPFDWQRLWDSKGVGISGRVCQCHRSYLERAGDDCTDDVQKCRHHTSTRALEMEMRNMILSDRTSLKAATFNGHFQGWEHETYACRGIWWTQGM